MNKMGPYALTCLLFSEAWNICIIIIIIMDMAPLIADLGDMVHGWGGGRGTPPPSVK